MGVKGEGWRGLEERLAAKAFCLKKNSLKARVLENHSAGEAQPGPAGYGADGRVAVEGGRGARRRT